VAQPIVEDRQHDHGQIFDLTLSQTDKKWLKSNYPLLKLSVADTGIFEINGPLGFDMVYDKDTDEFVISPGNNGAYNGVRIKDYYDIKVVFQKNLNSKLPQVYETGSRIITSAKEKSLPIQDLHISGNGAACLCIVDRESEYFPSGFNLGDFFNRLVIPFFYEQSYFKENNAWPWGEYAHGVFGVIERYGEVENHSKPDTVEVFNRIVSSDKWFAIYPVLRKRKNMQDYKKCLCGSKKKFRDCHMTILAGLVNLKNNLIKYMIPHRELSRK